MLEKHPADMFHIHSNIHWAWSEQILSTSSSRSGTARSKKGDVAGILAQVGILGHCQARRRNNPMLEWCSHNSSPVTCNSSGQEQHDKAASWESKRLISSPSSHNHQYPTPWQANRIWLNSIARGLISWCDTSGLQSVLLLSMTSVLSCLSHF